MKQVAIDFINCLPHRIEKLEVEKLEVKRNFIIMALFLECAGEADLRAIAYDLVIEDRLLDCQAWTIASELPRLVDEAREMLRYQREKQLLERYGRDATQPSWLSP